MIIATIESFIGSLWFAGMTALVGYIAGHIFPIGKLANLFKKGGK